ncbi:hypothetical protein ES705_41753 [subsurface metagenome]|jgi:excisionase family DNA binding protein
MERGSKMLTIQEVAKQLNCHYMTIYYWVRDGKLPAVQLNKIYRISEEDLKKFLKNKKVVAK